MTLPEYWSFRNILEIFWSFLSLFGSYNFFFYLDFLSGTFTIHRIAGIGGSYFPNSSLPLPPASQRLRHWPGDYCRELTSAVLFNNKINDTSRIPIFFLPGFSFTNIDKSLDRKGRGRAFLYSSLPLPPASQTLRH